MIKTIENKLHDIEDALLHVQTAQGLVDCQYYQPLIELLEAKLNAVKRQIGEQRAAVCSASILRPTFRLVGKPRSNMACVVFKPDTSEVSPHIDERMYENLRRLLCATASDIVEVCAKYDVLVKNDYNEVVAIVKSAR